MSSAEFTDWVEFYAIEAEEAATTGADADPAKEG